MTTETTSTFWPGNPQPPRVQNLESLVAATERALATATSAVATSTQKAAEASTSAANALTQAQNAALTVAGIDTAVANAKSYRDAAEGFKNAAQQAQAAADASNTTVTATAGQVQSNKDTAVAAANTATSARDIAVAARDTAVAAATNSAANVSRTPSVLLTSNNVAGALSQADSLLQAATKKDDLLAIGRYLTKITGTTIQTGGLLIDEFGDASGIDPSSVNANLQGGVVLNQAQDVNTKTLLHFDGTNGATTTTDAAGKTVTLSGATISTTQSKFGGSSLSLNGGGSATIAASTDFDLSSGDLTIEGFFYTNTANLTSVILMGSYGDVHTYNGQIVASVPGQVLIQGGSVSNSTWYHFALVRLGTTTTLYLNGASVGTTTASQFASGSQTVTIGSGFNGYIDEIRISKGIARYTANFTPPTSPFVYGTAGPLDLKSVVCPVPNGVTVSKAGFLAALKGCTQSDLNTKVIAKATRGNSQYATFTLVPVITLGGWMFVKHDGLDLSGLQAGSSPAYELTCTADLALQVDSVEFSYGA